MLLAVEPDDLPAAMARVGDALREDGETFSIAASGGAVAAAP